LASAVLAWGDSWWPAGVAVSPDASPSSRPRETFAQPRIWSEDAVVAVTIADELDDQIMTSS
jgi:hypothetical protein